MEREMHAWLRELREAPKKRPLPILAFPCVQLLGVNVRQLLSEAALQARGMQLVAGRTRAAAAVSLMDLSVEAECFGATVRFADDAVPTVVGRLIQDERAARALPVPAVGTARTGLCIEAVRMAAGLITDRPVLAGMIGPFSLAARLLEVSGILMDCYDEPDMVHTVLDKATAFLIQYGGAYRDTGAQGILLAEPVAGLLSPDMEREFVAPYVRRIVAALQDDAFPLIYHNCGGGALRMLDSMVSTGAAALHLGNAIDMGQALRQLPQQVVAMGNVDPAGVLCQGTPQAVRQATLALLENCGGYGNFVASTGCDIPPQTPWENIDAFFAAVEEHDAD